MYMCKCLAEIFSKQEKRHVSRVISVYEVVRQNEI